MKLNVRLLHSFYISVFTLLLAGLAPSPTTMMLSAVITTGAILYVAYTILKDDQPPQK